jgi:hypothetical protein
LNLLKFFSGHQEHPFFALPPLLQKFVRMPQPGDRIDWVQIEVYFLERTPLQSICKERRFLQIIFLFNRQRESFWNNSFSYEYPEIEYQMKTPEIFQRLLTLWSPLNHPMRSHILLKCKVSEHNRKSWYSKPSAPACLH